MLGFLADVVGLIGLVVGWVSVVAARSGTSSYAFLIFDHKLRLTVATENKTKARQRRVRAHGSHPTEPAPGSTLFSFPRYATLGSTAIAG